MHAGGILAASLEAAALDPEDGVAVFILHAELERDIEFLDATEKGVRFFGLLRDAFEFRTHAGNGLLQRDIMFAMRF